LIYADWLEERGDVYGEFIRVQVELSRLPTTCDTGCDGNPGGSSSSARVGLCSLHLHRADLTHRQWELLNEPQAVVASNAFRWSGMSLQLYLDMAPVFRRGFVEEVQCDLDDWLERGPELVRRQPIRRVSVRDREPWQWLKDLWCWTDYPPGPDADPKRVGEPELPPEIFELLPPGTARVRPSHGRYRSEQECLDALSKACLNYAYHRPSRGKATGQRRAGSQVGRRRRAAALPPRQPHPG
jgi:hypothetical protein